MDEEVQAFWSFPLQVMANTLIAPPRGGNVQWTAQGVFSLRNVGKMNNVTGREFALCFL